jgi:hypothetical protein
VKESVLLSIKYSPFSLADFVVILILPNLLLPFYIDPLVIDQTRSFALGFLRLHIGVQLIGAAYFQAAGRKQKKVLLTLKQTRIFPNSVSADSTKFLGIFECGLHSQSQIFYQRY